MPAPGNAQAVSWAHQNGSLQSNGSITIKSQSGGSYGGQLNPAGAVAKANQSAVTQPPTVIIQATNSGYVETIPLLSVGTPAPTCPTGYTALWSKVFPANTYSYVFNIGGTRWSFGSFNASSTNAVWMWIYDTPVESFYTNRGAYTATDGALYKSFNLNVGATLCGK